MKPAALMVHMDTSPAADQRLKLAVSMAAQYGARLIGVGSGETHAVAALDASGTVLRGETREIEQLLYVAGERFAGAAEALAEAGWRAEYGRPVEVLARNARAADVVVIGPQPDKSGLTELSLDPEEALMEIGRPVLYVPEGVEAWAGERIVVAWKDCKEARRAVYEALPILKRAKAVCILAVNEGQAHDAIDVQTYLAAHQIASVVEERSARFGAAGDEILKFADQYDADLIVAGAFSRSRGKEHVFGGVTVDLLRHARRCVLFSH